MSRVFIFKYVTFQRAVPQSDQLQEREIGGFLVTWTKYFDNPSHTTMLGRAIMKGIVLQLMIVKSTTLWIQWAQVHVLEATPALWASLCKQSWKGS